MKIIGIIIEANPLHNGHQYLIDQVKLQEKPDILIAITSTYFSMRGDISCYPKIDKVKYLLDAGFNLVFELPTSLAIQRSDMFAKNSINILSKLGITNLAFGMETDDKELINKVSSIYSSDDYDNLFKKEINQKQNYKKAQVSALQPFFTSSEWNYINNSNFFLGLEYLKILKDTNISPVIIKRIGPKYNDLVEIDSFASATYLRKLINDNHSINKYLPYQPETLINQEIAEKNLFKYWNFLVSIKPELFTKNSINSYLINNTKSDENYNDFINKLTTSKITKTRIKRTILTNLLNFNVQGSSSSYLRLLGFDSDGSKYLNTLPKEIKKQIFSSPNELKDSKSGFIYDELKAAKLYDLITENNFYPSEYKFPIRKD